MAWPPVETPQNLQRIAPLMSLLAVVLSPLVTALLVAGCGSADGPQDAGALDYFASLESELSKNRETVINETTRYKVIQTTPEEVRPQVIELWITDVINDYQRVRDALSKLSPPSYAQAANGELIASFRGSQGWFQALQKDSARYSLLEGGGLSELLIDPDWESGRLQFREACHDLQRLADDHDAPVTLPCTIATPTSAVRS